MSTNTTLIPPYQHPPNDVRTLDPERTTSMLVGLMALCYLCFFVQLSSTLAR
jgi:hypothetical protein